MSPTLRVLLIVASIICTLYMLRKIAQSKVHIEDSIFWIVGSFFLVIISVFPGVADWMRDLCGIDTTVHFLFLFMIFILFVKVFYMTIKISQLEAKIKDLTQRYAIDNVENKEEDEVGSHDN